MLQLEIQYMYAREAPIWYLLRYTALIWRASLQFHFATYPNMSCRETTT
jgi:hypothetical protein